MLSQSRSKGVSLGDLIGAELGPYMRRAATRSSRVLRSISCRSSTRSSTLAVSVHLTVTWGSRALSAKSAMRYRPALGSVGLEYVCNRPALGLLLGDLSAAREGISPSHQRSMHGIGFGCKETVGVPAYTGGSHEPPRQAYASASRTRTAAIRCLSISMRKGSPKLFEMPYGSAAQRGRCKSR